MEKSIRKIKNTDLQTYKTIDNPDQGKKIAAEYASKIGDLIDSKEVGQSFTNEVQHNVNSLINEFEKFAGLPITTPQERVVLRELDRNLKELEEMLKNEKSPEHNPPSS